jgi:pimeloyl-ACP methyl ester carboxylesterase
MPPSDISFRRVRPARTALLFTIVACLELPGLGDPLDRLGACPPTAPTGAECQRLAVPERPELAQGKQIELQVIRVPSRAARPAPDPAVIIVGGPGQAASSLATMLASRFSGILATRDLILVDQRGTGGSNRLACASGAAQDPARLLGPVFTREEMDACAAALSARADLEAYTTTNAARDLEAVRRHLGVAQWNLLAGSYGTKVAMEYARLFPAATRSMVLEGVAGPEYPNPLPHARGGQAALDSLLGACERDTRCNAAYPGLRDALPGLWARLDSAPVPVIVPGRSEAPPLLERDNLAYGLHLLLFSNQSSPAVPYLLSRAVAADYWPIANVLAQVSSGLAAQIDFGMQLSVTCMEDTPAYTYADAEREGAGTYLRASMARGAKEECERWPVTPTTPLPVVPLETRALLLTGAYDPATPPDYAARVAGRMPNALSVLVPYGAHVTVDNCVNGIITQYVAALSVTPDVTACLQRGSRPPFLVPGG